MQNIYTQLFQLYCSDYLHSLWYGIFFWWIVGQFVIFAKIWYWIALTVSQRQFVTHATLPLWVLISSHLPIHAYLITKTYRIANNVLYIHIALSASTIRMSYHHSPPKFKHAKLVILFSQLAAHARIEPIAKLATITNCISLIQRTTNAKSATISYLSVPPAFQHTYA